VGKSLSVELPLAPQLVEGLVERVGGGKVLGVLGVEALAVGQHAAHVGAEEVRRAVGALAQPLAHRAQVHRVPDEAVVVGHLVRVHWLSNQHTPIFSQPYSIRWRFLGIKI